MAGNRLWFAVQAAIFYTEANSNGTGAASQWDNGVAAHGVQDVSINTNFQITPVFELGQAAVYENTEGTPTVEITISKVLDGHPLLLQLATQGANAPSLMTRLGQKCTFQLGLWPDEHGDSVADPVHDALATIVCPDVYISSISYTFRVDESATESLTLTGSRKIWQRRAGARPDMPPWNNVNNFDVTFLNNQDAPDKSIAQWYHVIMDNPPAGAVSGDQSVFPEVIPGIGPGGINAISGAPDKENTWSGTPSFARIQSVTISAQTERTDLKMLGRKSAFYKSAASQVPVTTEIVVLATLDDGVSAAADESTWCEGQTTSQYKIRISACNGNNLDTGIRVYTGTKNKLTSVAYGQGGTGGGNVTATYSFQTHNHLTVIANSDDDYGNITWGPSFWKPNPAGTKPNEQQWWENRSTWLNIP